MANHFTQVRLLMALTILREHLFIKGNKRWICIFSGFKTNEECGKAYVLIKLTNLIVFWQSGPNIWQEDLGTCLFFCLKTLPLSFFRLQHYHRGAVPGSVGPSCYWRPHDICFSLWSTLTPVIICSVSITFSIRWQVLWGEDKVSLCGVHCYLLGLQHMADAHTCWWLNKWMKGEGWVLLLRVYGWILHYWFLEHK